VGRSTGTSSSGYSFPGGGGGSSTFYNEWSPELQYFYNAVGTLNNDSSAQAAAGLVAGGILDQYGVWKRIQEAGAGSSYLIIYDASALICDPVMTMRTRVHAVPNGNFFLGLAAAAWNEGHLTAPAANAIGLWYNETLHGDLLWRAISTDNAAALTTYATALTVTADAILEIQFTVTANGTHVVMAVNGTDIQTFDSATDNLPLAANGMGQNHVCCKINDGGANTSIDVNSGKTMQYTE